MTDEIKSVTGTCQFCGQIRMIEKSEDEWLELIQKMNKSGKYIADFLATIECTCRDGLEWRAEQGVLKKAGEHIEFIFRDEYPEIADILQETKELIWHQQIKKIQIITPENYSARMIRSKGQLKVFFEKKNVTEMTATV